MSLSEAIRRVTAFPAERFRLSGKGTLGPGSDADLVIFRPEELRTPATFERPELPPEGIYQVWIGGKQAYRDGTILTDTAGTSVRVF